MLKLGPHIATPTPPTAEVGIKLLDFSRAAEKSRRSFQLRAQRNQPDQDMIEELRALGYVR